MILGASVLIVGCASSEVPALTIEQSDSSTYSIENVTKKIVIDGGPYDQTVSQKLIWNDPHTDAKEVIIDDLAKSLKTPSLGLPLYRIVSQPAAYPDILYFLVVRSGPDTVAYNLLKYNARTKTVEPSPLEDLFNLKSGDLIQAVASQQYIWAPFIDGGINTEDREIFLVDFATETSSVIVSLPDTETLNGADHCDHFNFITDMTVTDGMLKYAVYSRTKLHELYADACSGNGDNELQARNAKEAFLEYRTLDITDIRS